MVNLPWFLLFATYSKMKHIPFLKKATMPDTLLMGVSTVFAGTAIAAVRDEVRIMPMLLCILFVAAGQLASNCTYVFNDLRNHHGNTALEEIAGRLNRQEDTELYGMLRIIAGVATIFAVTIGFMLASYCGAWSLLLGALLFILSYLNVQGPMPLVGTPFGPLITYLVFGPIGVVGTFLLQFADSTFAILSWFDIGPAVYFGLSIGFLAVNVHIAIEYQHYRMNLLTHRTSVVTELGRKFSRYAVFFGGFGMWIFFYIMVDSHYCQHPLLDMIMPTISMVVNCIVWYKLRRFSPAKKGIRPSVLAVANMLLLALVTMILFISIGTPDSAIRDYYTVRDIF